MKTKINQQNAQINPELICAFCWFIFVFCRTPLDEWSVRRRDLYQTTRNIYNRQTTTPLARFEPAIRASEQLQSHAVYFSDESK